MSGIDGWGERLPRRLGLWSAVAVIMGTTIGSGIIVSTAAVNYRGVHLGALVQNVSTVLKISALLGIAIAGLALVPATAVDTAAEAVPLGSTAAIVSAFGLALVSILWAYDGFADLVFVAGEVKDPERNLPRALVVGTGGIIVLYLLTNWIYARVIPLPEMPGSPLIAADVAVALFGTFGVVFISAAVALSTYGSLNGSTMTGPRIFFAMAEDGLFFRGIAAVHPRFGTPARSIVLMAGLGTFYVYVRTFAQLADQFIIGIWPFYAAAVAALFVLRRRHADRPRPYRPRGYPWVPAAFLLGATFVLGNYLIQEPWIFIANMAAIGIGAPVYWFWVRQRRAR